MKLLVNPIDYQNAIELINLGTHIITVGQNDFSCRNSNNLNIDEIAKLIKQKKQTLIYVLINRFFFEPEISNLQKYLVAISKLKIDAIIFSDYAVAQILHEQKISIKLIYNPETMVVNYGQFAFYQKNKISGVFLARELSWTNLLEFSKNKNNQELFLQVAGYSYMFQSRWDLITNFAKAYKLSELKANKPYLIKEENRQIPFQIIQDHSGTHIYSCYNLCLLKTISKLIKAKIDVLCIDTFLHDKDWTLLTTKAYLDAIANPKKNISEVIINEFTKYDHYLSQGFFELKKENLLYLSNELQLTWNND